MVFIHADGVVKYSKNTVRNGDNKSYMSFLLLISRIIAAPVAGSK